MEPLVVVLMLILLQTLYFGIEVGRARQRLRIEAPAVSGNDEFDRYFRAHQNSLEQLIVFLPAVLVAAYLGYSITCVVCGVFYLVGRAIYFRSYVKDPKKRTLGFVLSFFSTVILIMTSLVSSILIFF
tara:strand:- start:699 stop:1082 length:384 start_codon:yes stop_codon:yes gene_type:complete